MSAIFVQQLQKCTQRRDTNHTDQAERKFDCIIAVLTFEINCITWLPVQQRIELKVFACVVVVLVSARNQVTQTCLAEMCTPASASTSLRSAAHGDLVVPRCRMTRYYYGQRSFAVSGPTLWNSLPQIVRGPSLTLTR